MIFIPGFLGSVLAQRDTGRQVWGSMFANHKVTPHSSLIGSDYERLDLPTASADLGSNRDALVATGILERMTVIPHVLSVGVYGRWIDALAKAGLEPGDIDHPKKTDVCFVFAYDWRRDLVESARLLAERIDAIRAVSGDPDLEVDLIAHSMGGLIARYYLLYGGEDALVSVTPPEPTLAGARHVANLFLLGTPNQGSIWNLIRLLHGGRVGVQNIDPLAWFTMPSVYELLPSPGDPVLIDASGRPVTLDIYNIRTWIENSWGVFDPERRALYRNVLVEHLGGDGERALAAKYEEWARFVGVALERARRFHGAVEQDRRIALRVRYHLMGSRCKRTLDRGVVETSQAGRLVVVAPQRTPRGLRRKTYRRLILGDGDGTVTTASLLGLPSRGDSRGGTGIHAGEDSRGSAFPGATTFWSCVGHLRLQDDARIQQRILEILRTGE